MSTLDTAITKWDLSDDEIAQEEQPMKASTIEMVNTGVPNTRAARMVTEPKRSTSTPDEVTVVWSTRPETCSCGGAGAPTVGGKDWVPRLWDTSGVGSWEVLPDAQCGNCGSILTSAWVLRDGHLDDEEIVEIALGIEGEAVGQLALRRRRLVASLTEDALACAARIRAGEEDEDDLPQVDSMTEPGVGSVPGTGTIEAWDYDPATMHRDDPDIVSVVVDIASGKVIGQ